MDDLAKTCIRCNNTKALDNFYTKKTKSKNEFRLGLICIICKVEKRKLIKSQDSKRNYNKNKEKVKLRHKDWVVKNKAKIPGYDKKYYLKHPDKIKAKILKYHKENKQKIALAKVKYREENKIKISEYNKKYTQDKRKNDFNFKLSDNLRSRFRQAFKKRYKTGSAIKELGISIPEFKLYLERLFEPGMSWENYGRTGWHIDHIKPLSKFDLKDIEEVREACYFGNLQPLWARDNLIKSNKN